MNSSSFSGDIPFRNQENIRPLQTATIKNLSVIRKRESYNRASESLSYQPLSTSNSRQQKRPYEFIDLTKDEYEAEPLAAPRKKSSSSPHSLENSFSLKKDELKSEDSSSLANPFLYLADKVPSHPVSPFSTTSEEPAQQPTLQDISSEPLEQRRPTYPSHSPPSSRERYSQSQQNPRQYASAVVVRSIPQPADPTLEERQQRRQFLQNMRVVSNLTLYNSIDNSSPPTKFRFVTSSILQPGVSRAPQDVMVGCDCRKRRGINECRYPNECSCLKDSGGESLKKTSQYAQSGAREGCLVKTFLNNRWNIFECNPRCDCSANCKNRIVQWGRKVGLEIFKTRDRGWGLRCHRDLLEGQFVDTYRGEIITTEEADRRKKGANEDNYLFNFDKFDEDVKYVCDGREMGGPTRFMNNSCQPNCALFTVSYNHYDPYIYELAFFAMEFIPKGTELTFDYMDQDEVDRTKITDEMAAEMEIEKGYAPSKCFCGAENCRGYFFYSA